MTRNSGDFSESQESISANPSSLLLRGHWRHLRSLVKGSPEYLMMKEFLFHVYAQDAIKNAKSFFRKRVPTKSLVALEDAIQSVMSRLWKTIDRFDPERFQEADWNDPDKNPFMQFFNGSKKSPLRGAIIDSLRELQHFPRSEAAKLRRYHKIMRLLRQQLEREPTLEDYLDHIGWGNVKEVENPLLFSQVFNQSNAKPGEILEEEMRFEGDRRLERRPIEYIDWQQAEARVAERIALEKEILAMVPDQKARGVVLAYYFWGWSITKIADAKEISFTLVSKLLKAGREAIRERCTEQQYIQIIGRIFIKQISHRPFPRPISPQAPRRDRTPQPVDLFPEENPSGGGG